MKAGARVLWGIRELLWPAAAASLLALLAYWADGGFSASARESLWAICAWYLAMALIGGAVLGLARPLARGPVGTGFVGFLTAVPIVFLVLFANPVDRIPWTFVDVLIAFAVAAVVGPIAAAYVTLRWTRGESNPPGV